MTGNVTGATTNATGAKPLTPRGERTRAALVAAARVIFERDGFGESRLIDITGQANVAAGSFYTYFASKEEILQAVLADAQEDMLHPGEPHVEVDDDDPTEVIAAANRAYFEAYARNAQLMVVLDQVAATHPDFRRLRRERTELFMRRNAKRIEDLQKRGLADPDLQPAMAASALSAMVSRMAYHYFTLEDADLWADDDVRPGMEALVFTATRLWVNAIGLRDWRAGAAASGTETSAE
ncbi:TetR/AcrR family transcriptional regulator [Gordonia sp. TBRC 11910]|uniref:TetR/AcrR family transcriptional regulator n=1 Tax=Gordonia asplenii TaxID=2725283 RepID=A0A848L2H5_9ACTN|nr:TetR/AcrR family transcriptional regulator [Gordonia asplenii]NMO04939.1 TetR/AcrR family transcriptional regulator [Gordonia asplenii]